MLHIEANTYFKKRRKNKRGFPTGTVFFTGRQGAGKSLSASHYLARLKKRYPDLYIYSNIKLKIADKVLRSDEIADHILDRKIEGEACGRCSKCLDNELCVNQKEIPIAFFIDEIQTVLFSEKKSVSFETFKAICQQRKALKTIIGTMQEFLDLDIKYRRQLLAFVECIYFGNTQFELWKSPSTLKYDPKVMNYVAKTFDVRIWKRHNEAYDIYDTYEIVGATLGMSVEKQQAHSTKHIPVTFQGLSP